MFDNDRKEKKMIIYRNVSELKFAPFNPPKRTEKLALELITRSMKKDGFWSHCPIVITTDGTIADGHRRVTVAKELGIEKVPCIVTDKPLEEVWAGINGTMRPPNSAETIMAMHLGLNCVPENRKRGIAIVVANLGEDGIHYLAEHNKSPYVIEKARSVAIYCGLIDDQEFVIRCVHWMVELTMQFMVAVAMKQGIPIDVLIEKINNNEPLKMWD